MSATKSLELPRIGRREPDTDARQARTPSRTLLRVLVVAAVLLLAAAVWLTVLSSRESAVQDSRTAAIANAKTRIPKLLSYQHDHLNADLAEAVSMTTGKFHADYQNILTKVVAPTAAEKRIDSVAEVTSVGVVRATRDRVVVLAFLTQRTTTNGSAPSVIGSRVEVTMLRVGDQWLVSDLEPV
jgi:Mce-associated membrane protein